MPSRSTWPLRGHANRSCSNFGKQTPRSRHRWKQSAKRRLRVELLEDRRLLTADMTAAIDDPFVDASKHIGHDHETSPVVNFYPEREHYFRAGEYLTETDAQSPLVIATAFLDNALDLDLDPRLQDFVVVDQYQTAHNGVSHFYVQQRFNGLPVANSSANINVDNQGRVLNAGIAFATSAGDAFDSAQEGFDRQVAGERQLGVAQSGKRDGIRPPAWDALQPGLSAEDALVLLAEQMEWQVASAPEVLSQELEPANRGHRQLISDAGLSVEPIPAELHYVAEPYGLQLAWRFEVQRPGGDGWYDVHVNAGTGAMLHLVDWVNEASYNVYALPKESPTDGGRTNEVDPQDASASPFGWHDTNGVSGAEFTITRGNNAWAYADRDGNNVADAGSAPSGGAGLNFNFALNLANDPLVYQDASIANLFYWNNILHDIHYQYGFDEVAGNFQENNYGNGGLGSDSVLAEAQDQADGGPQGAQRNNANFATPPDGSNPRMQMFIWNITTPNRDSSLDAGIVIHEYAHGVSNRLTGGPSNAGALTTRQSGGMGEGWSDWHALMLTQVAADTASTPRGIATYSIGQPASGSGIRTQRYSYDMSQNTLTFGDITNDAIVHDTGEVWASVLWDLNWALIEGNSLDPNLNHVGLGFDPDLYAGTGGNNVAMQLVMDGMKLQPSNPTFLEARDAILAADVALTGGQYQLLIWKVFARRGMGFSADDAGNSNSLAVTEAFDVPSGPNGQVEFDAAAYPEGSLITVHLRDSDLSTSQSLQIVSSGGDVETIVVDPTSSIGFLVGTIDTSAGAVAADGLLQVGDGDMLTVTYVDADDGLGGTNVTKTATADVLLRSASLFEDQGPAGSLLGLSPNVATLRSADDIEPFAFFAEAGELIEVTARPFGAATLDLEIMGLSGLVQSPAAGAPAVLPPQPIPVTGFYEIQLSADQAVTADITLARNGSWERQLGDSSDGNELEIDSSGLPLSAGQRFAVSATSIPVGPGIENGSFETGDFTGWDVLAIGNVLEPWTVSTAGNGTGFGLAPTAPQDGSFVAWNGFEAAGPMNFEMTQDVYLPAQPVDLSWKHRIQWDFGVAGGIATERRTFEVQVRDPDSGAVLDSLYYFETPREFEQVSGDTGWQTITADLSVFAGQLVTLAFVEHIPQIFTGPGQFEIDDIQLVGMPAAAPDIDEFEVDLSAYAGKSIDVVFASVNAEFASSTVELLDTDGTTILATASTSPAGPTVTNYRQGILDFVVPSSPGTYTIRVTSNAFGDYQLLLNESLVFDTEPNDAPATPLRSLDDVSGALGFVDGVNTYSVAETAYSFDDLSTGATPIFLGDDTVSSARNIGFDFNFYGQTYNQFYASSNGFLTFLPNQFHGCCIGPPIPTTGSPNAVIAGWWRDLIPETNPTSFIRYRTSGAAGQRVLVVEYNEYAHFSDRSLRVTMQFKLFEASGAIEVHYLKAPGDEFEHTAGIENATGTEGVEFYRGTDSLPNEFAVRYELASAVDGYALDLQAGQEVVLQTATPLDNVGHANPNTLDPELIVLHPDGSTVVAADTDSRDGKNAELTFTAPVAGEYTIRVLATSGLGSYLLDWQDPNADVEGPQITDVIVGSSQWGPAFIDVVDGGGVESGNALGVSLPSGEQLRNLPWITLDKIYIQFNENIGDGFTVDNVKVNGINTPDYAGLFSLDYGVDGPNVGTITFNESLTSDILFLTLFDTIVDASGNPLDGEWDDAISAASGDGTNGGDFVFRLDVLPGDVNDNGGVNFADVFAAYALNGSTSTAAISHMDVNGNGAINFADVFGIYALNGTSLPSMGGGLSGEGEAGFASAFTANGRPDDWYSVVGQPTVARIDSAIDIFRPLNSTGTRPRGDADRHQDGEPSLARRADRLGKPRSEQAVDMAFLDLHIAQNRDLGRSDGTDYNDSYETVDYLVSSVLCRALEI